MSPKQVTQKQSKLSLGLFFVFATRQGLEPRLTGPKPVVLPLDDRVKGRLRLHLNHAGVHYHSIFFLVTLESKND